ncbi:MAG: HAMP domain-containing histidine kinase, partial [Anaerolineae bacterium]|nr:HAMP domain-containing histidine kinase [Anaerolineae bacterium]
DELYLLCQSQGDLTFQAYESFGGVQGAIGTRAENTFLGLDEPAQEALPQVFLKLVDLDDEGVATRQRTQLKHVVTNEVEKQLVDALTSARLLVQSFGEDRQPVIEVAHEALFRSWERLGKWLQEAQSDIRYQQRLRHDTKWWVDNGKRPHDLYRGAKLEEALLWAQKNKTRMTDNMNLFIETAQVVEQREQAKSALNTAILDSVDVGVIQADPDGKVIQVSPAAEQILQVTAADFVNQPITQFARQFRGSVIKWQEALERWNTTPELDSDFLEDILKFQSRTFNSRLSPVKKHQQFLGVLLVVRETTSQDVAALNSQFLSIISHDLRSPLTLIRGYSEIMQSMEETIDAERRKEMLQRITAAADNMVELINQLLDISRAESGIQDFYPEAVNFALYCKEYVENFQKNTPSHTFIFSQTDSCAEAKVDIDIRRFDRIFVNLLSNAVKYSSEGSRV